MPAPRAILLALFLCLSPLDSRAQDAGAGAAPAEEPLSASAEVSVRASRTSAQRLQESAEAVTVVDTRKAQQQTADLGEVLARTQGVGVRREGGLGSGATIALNGLQGDQVRLFLDEVPLQYAGYPFGFVNVPVNLIDRIEIYRGVVPIRFGADALGGAINLVTDQRYETHLGASYQVGSYNTVRTTVNGRYLHEPTGFVAGGAAYFDTARNDFWMDDRKYQTPEGGTELRSVRRGHDAYRAGGGNLEFGVVDKPWARRLLLKGFVSSFDKDLQHNSVMSVPYGAITYGETIYGVAARYEADLSKNVQFEALANYAHRVIDFTDVSPYKYAWDGSIERDLPGDDRGELFGRPIDRSYTEHTFYGRAGVGWMLVPGHTLRFSTSPAYSTRTGEDHAPNGADLLGLTQKALQLVSGAEYQMNPFDDTLEVVTFVKDYVFNASLEERVANQIVEHARDIHRLGGGSAARYRFTPWLIAKLSYEYATRLPRPDELFGDGVLVKAADDILQPEKSHNVNVGPRLDLKDNGAGAVIVDVNFFLRESKDMIVLIAGRQDVPYSNIANARTLGVENAIAWTSPGRWLKVDGTFTWQDVRNTSTTGPFTTFNGMRIPSRPYLFSSWGARYRLENLPDPDDALEVFYYGRYVHGFERGWAIGTLQFDLDVAAQLSHNVGVTWLLGSDHNRFSSTLEVSNLTDARLYDVFGVQRAGRAIYFKITGQNPTRGSKPSFTAGAAR